MAPIKAPSFIKIITEVLEYKGCGLERIILY